MIIYTYIDRDCKARKILDPPLFISFRLLKDFPITLFRLSPCASTLPLSVACNWLDLAKKGERGSASYLN
jgi:hypothetical protein